MTRVTKGDAILAEHMNRALSAADKVHGIKGGSNVGLSETDTGLTVSARVPVAGRSHPFIECAAKNTGATTLQINTAAVITGHVYSAGDDGMYKETILTCRRYSGADGNSPLWGIVIESMKQNEVGRLCVMGVCLASVTGSAADRADITESAATGALTMDNEGRAEVIWTSGGLALIRFPVSDTGAAGFDERYFFGNTIATLDFRGLGPAQSGDKAYTYNDNQFWIYSNFEWTACLRFTGL